MSDLEYLDRYPATVDCAGKHDTFRNASANRSSPLGASSRWEHAGVSRIRQGAPISSDTSRRVLRSGFAAASPLRSTTLPNSPIKSLAEIGLDLAPGNTRASVFFDSLRRRSRASEFVLKAFERPLAHLRGNVEPFISANAAIHSFLIRLEPNNRCRHRHRDLSYEFTLSTQYVVKRLRCQLVTQGQTEYRMRQMAGSWNSSRWGCVFRRIDRILFR